MNNRIKKVLFIGILFFSHFSVHGQFSIKTGLVSPTGYMGAVLKKAPFISVGKIANFNGRFRSRFMGEFIYFSPRQERFDIYAYVTEGNTETVYPGTQSINLYMNLNCSIGYDFGVVNKGDFHWFIGMDAFVGMTLRQYEEDVPLVVTGRDFSGIPMIGLRGRTGLEYSFDKFSLFVDVSRSYYLNTEGFILNYNEYGIGIRF